jgi:putative nucleotidyltransferase with HDIG domain
MSTAAVVGEDKAIKRILFVDDEPSLLDGLRRMLRPQRGQWDMQFVNSADEALLALEQHPVDIVVSDMRMPGMDGAQLLERVRDRFPGVVRIILSGYCDMPSTLRAVPVAHQFLQKPCGPGSLLQAVERACGVSATVRDDTVRRVVGAVGELPCLPGTSAALVRALDDPDVPVSAVGHIVERDVAIAAKVMQLANSAFFGRSQEITAVGHAVTYLGSEVLRQLVITAEVFRAFRSAKEIPGYTFKGVQGHSQMVAAIAALLPVPPKEKPVAAVAALLHDIGKLIMAARMPTACEEIAAVVVKEGITLDEAEDRVINTGHAEIGSYLLALWGLPIPIVNAVASHRKLAPGGESPAAFGVAEAVYFANRLALELQSPPADGVLPELPADALDYLKRAGLEGQLPSWRELASHVEPE